MKEMYCTEDKKDCINKKEVNNFIAETSNNISKRHNSERVAIVLDAETLKTTTTLEKHGFDSFNILIPNPYIYKKIAKKHLFTYNCTLNTLLNKHIYTKVDVAFFDYCCTFSGNIEVNPKKDILVYFKKKLPDKNSLFAVTFSKRDSKIKEPMNKARKYIMKTAKQYGYKSQLIYKKEYADHGAMFVLVYKIY